MAKRAGTFFVIILATALSATAQQAQPSADPSSSMAYDMSRIALAVQSMTKTLKEFVDKFEKAEGISITEKQAKLVVGMQVLVQAEQRVATLQKFQIELVEKEGQFRSRLTQVENDLNAQNIDRSVMFEGGTQSPELKENRRRGLTAERSSLQGILREIQSSLQRVNSDLTEAHNFVLRLRRAYLPMVEKELTDLFQ